MLYLERMRQPPRRELFLMHQRPKSDRSLWTIRLTKAPLFYRVWSVYFWDFDQRKLLCRQTSRKHFLPYSTVGCRRTVCRRTARLEFHLKIRTTPGCKNSLTTPKQRLLWRRLLRRHCWLRKDSTSKVWNISTAFPAWHASSPTVCALQANQRDSKTDWKIRTRLAGVVENKNDLGWDRLPHVLRHPTVM